MKIAENQLVPRKLKMYLKDKGYNIAEIARKADLKPDDLYNMMSGRKVMTADVFTRICKTIGVSGSEIAEYDTAA